MKSSVYFILALSLSSCASGIYKEDNVEQLPPAEYLDRLSQAPDALIIDVRTGMEYRKNHLDKAVNASYLSFAFGKKMEGFARNQPVFIYCETAHRSPYAAKKLHKMGFERIIDLQGGHKALRRYKSISAHY
jgi:rhodanese-related sulfurtransferase